MTESVVLPVRNEPDQVVRAVGTPAVVAQVGIGLRGLQGLSVASAAIDGAGHLILTLSDASTVDAGELPGGGGVGAVVSVNGLDGVVVLTAADVGAAADDDARLSDARTPTAHAASHADGGSDAVTLAQSQVTGLVAALAAKLAAGDLAGVSLTDFPAGLARDAEVTNAISDEATARNAAIAAAISNLINSAPGALDTLDEIAAALGDDANFAATITGLLAGKQPLDADLTAIAALTTTTYGRSLLEAVNAAGLRTLAGLVLGTDIYSKAAVDSGFQPLDSDLTAIAALTTTTFGRSLLAMTDAAAVKTALSIAVADVSGAAPLASPALTGNPTAPTQSAGNSSTRLATTAFVAGNAIPQTADIAAVVKITQAAYDLLSPPSSTTLYVIVG